MHQWSYSPDCVEETLIHYRPLLVESLSEDLESLTLTSPIAQDSSRVMRDSFPKNVKLP